MLLVLSSHITFTSASNDVFLHETANDNNSKDMFVSSQNYRPYNYNQRPNYPSNYNGNNRLPSYQQPNDFFANIRLPDYLTNYRPNYGTTQRPNYQPTSPTTGKIITINDRYLASEAGIEGENTCEWDREKTTTNSMLGPPGICWDPTNQKIRIAHNLTIENFVIFYARMERPRSLYQNASFRDQICEQSRRFNSVGLICVPNKKGIPYSFSAESASDVECPANARKTNVIECTKENCICYLDQYHEIAKEQQNRNFRMFKQSLVTELLAYHANALSNRAPPLITYKNFYEYFPSSYNISAETLVQAANQQSHLAWLKATAGLRPFL